MPVSRDLAIDEQKKILSAPLSSVTQTKMPAPVPEESPGFGINLLRSAEFTVAGVRDAATQLATFSDIIPIDNVFDKEGFYRAKFGDDDSFYKDYMRNVDNVYEAQSYTGAIKAKQRMEYVQSRGSIVGNVAAALATDPVAWATAAGSAPLFSAAKGMLKTAAIAGGEGAFYELLQSQIDPTRTTEETVTTIGASIVLGGLLGGINVDAPMRRTSVKSDTYVDDTLNKMAKGDAGAMRARPEIAEANLQFYSRFKGKGAVGDKINNLMAKAAWLSPGDRLFAMDSSVAKRYLAKFKNPSLLTVGNIGGSATNTSVNTYRRDLLDNVTRQFRRRELDLIDEAIIAEGGKSGGVFRNLSNRQKIKEFSDRIYDTHAFIAHEARVNNANPLAILDSMEKSDLNPTEKILFNAIRNRIDHYVQLDAIASKANIPGHRSRNFYAYTQEFDRSKITPQNRVDFEQKLRSQLKGFTANAMEDKYRRLGDIEAMRREFLQTISDEVGVTGDVLLKKVDDGLGVIKNDVDAIMRELGDASPETRARVESALDSVRKADEEWREFMGDILSDENFIDRMSSKLLANIENGTFSADDFIMGRGGQAVPFFFKTRVFDAYVMKDYMNKNLTHLDIKYSRVLGVKQGMMAEYGTTDLNDIVTRMSNEITDQVRTLSDVAAGKQSFDEWVDGDDEIALILQRTGNDKEAIGEAIGRLNKDLAEASDGIRSLHDAFTGRLHADVYKEFGRASEILMAGDVMMNFASMGLGAFAQLMELTAPLNTWGSKALLPQMKNAVKLATSKEFRKLSEKQAMEVGNLSQWMMHVDVGNIIEEAGSLGASKLQNKGFYEFANKSFYTINGMAPLDRYVRILAQTTNDEMLYRAVKRVADGTANGRDISTLARMGFSKDEAKMLLQKLDESRAYHDFTEMGFTNFDKIGDSNLGFRLREAHRRLMDEQVLAASEGDAPHVWSHPAMRVLLKFKNWTTQATNKYLLLGLQHSDAQTLSTWSLMTMMGMMSNEFKAAAVGKSTSDEDIIDKIYGGASTAGYFGFAHYLGMDYAASISGIEGGGARYAERTDTLESFIGPYARVFDAADEVLSLGSIAADESKDIESLDDLLNRTRNLQRLMPGQQVIRTLNRHLNLEVE